MSKVKINDNLSIGTILQRIQCLDEVNTILQAEIAALEARRNECCAALNGYSVEGELITVEDEPLS